MTGRATFGDFADAARAQLRGTDDLPDLAAGRGADSARAGPAREFTRSMVRIVAVMTRYADDIAAVLTPSGSPRGSVSGAWPHASLRARESIQNTAAFLQPAPADFAQADHPRTADPAARRLDAATAFLAAGRDLLRTHVATTPDGRRVDRSEWAPVVMSLPVARALLLELGLWARRIAAQGSRLALPGPAAGLGTGEERHQLNAACQWLWVLDSAVQAAQRHHPVSAAEVQLLHAIPVNAPAPRRIPGATETITSLCQGTTSTAERVRHAATSTVPDATWSPTLTAESLRHAAACSTVISHNCEMLLRALAVRARQHGSSDIAAGLSECAEAAAQARAAWLNAARAWYRITTDTCGTIAQATAETADLALWTGRLTYTDPNWTPALGPAHTTRSPETLAPEPGDLADVVAAVHQACETMTTVAAADKDRIRAAAQARRLLVPSRSLPNSFDIPYPFAPVPRDRVGVLLAAYNKAGSRSAHATAAVATIAENIRAPSHILTAVRAPARGDNEFTPNNMQQSAESAAEPQRTRGFPGPVERLLHDLGVTSPAMLERASAIDQIGEQIILDAIRATEPQQAGPEAIGLSRSTGPAELINQMLASGSPRAAAMLRPPLLSSPLPEGQEPDRSPANRRCVGHQNGCSTPQAEAEP